MPWMAVAGVVAGVAGAVGSVASAAISQTHTKYSDPTEGANKWNYEKDAGMWNEGEGYQGKAEENYLQGQQAREGLQKAASLTEGIAQGGPSVANAVLKQGLDRGVNEAANTAAGAQGDVGLALANTTQQQQQAQLVRQTGQDAAVLKAQEMAAARAQLGDLYGNMRAGDLQTAGMRIGQGQFYNQASMAEGDRRLDAERSWQQFKAGGKAQAQGMAAQQDQRNSQLMGQGVGGAISSMGQGIAGGLRGYMQQKTMDADAMRQRAYDEDQSWRRMGRG